MAVARPDDTLRKALRRLGPGGERAEQMLDSAAEHVSGSEALGLQHASYALREAVMAIVKIDTSTVPGIREAAGRVVELHGAGVGDDVLARAVEALHQTLEGAGRNDTAVGESRGRLVAHTAYPSDGRPAHTARDSAGRRQPRRP